MKKTLLLSTLAASLFALTSSVEAAKSKGMEKCYGVVKSGFGTTEATGSGEYIYLPKGTCAKLTNGSVTFVETKSSTTTTTEGGTSSTDGTTTTNTSTGSSDAATDASATKTAATGTSGTTGGEVTMTKAEGTTGGNSTTSEGNKY